MKRSDLKRHIQAALSRIEKSDLPLEDKAEFMLKILEQISEEGVLWLK